MIGTAIALLIQVCEGPMGPAGLAGTDGADGLPGADGTNGTAGVDATYLPPAGTYFSLAVNNNAGDMQFGSFVNYLAFDAADETIAAGSTIPKVLATETTLPPEIDGSASTGEWSGTATTITLEQITDFAKYDGVSPIGVTSIDVTAMYDESYVYFLLAWDDADESDEKAKLTWDGTEWRASGNEDRFYMMFPVTGFTGNDFANDNGCKAFCHYDEASENGKGYMFTHTTGMIADVWQWKASRGNPVGFIHDKHMVYQDSTALNASDTKPKSFSGRKGDQGQDTYIENKLSSGLPKYMHVSDPDANASYPSMVWDMVPFDATATFTAEATIPGVFLRAPNGSSADVVATGIYTGTGWVVEVKRARNTGQGDDHQFLP